MASCFHPVTPELLDDLKKVVGEKYVRYDEDTLDQYQTDEEGNPHFFKKPEVVVFPGSTEEVASIVKLANQYLVPITPRAAGSGVACGAIPIYHGMVVELERMNKILELNANAMYAVVQTGVYCAQLQEEAKNMACSMQLIPLLHLPARSAAMLQTMQAATRLSSTGRRATRSMPSKW